MEKQLCGLQEVNGSYGVDAFRVDQAMNTMFKIDGIQYDITDARNNSERTYEQVEHLTDGNCEYMVLRALDMLREYNCTFEYVNNHT